MERISIWVLPLSFLLLIPFSRSSTDERVKQSLLAFFQALSGGNSSKAQIFGWNSLSDPCSDAWTGVFCHRSSVGEVELEGLGLSGTLDATSLCTIPTLTMLNIQNNNIHGELQPEITKCTQLKKLYLSENRFSGNLPESLTGLYNLKKLFISRNNFTGKLPNLPKISGLSAFLCEYNQLSGKIPRFNFANFEKFNASFNDFSGRVPNVDGKFNFSSFYGNSRLCGEPMPSPCPKRRKLGVGMQVLMFIGYIILGLVVIIIFILTLLKRKNTTNDKIAEFEKKGDEETDIKHSNDSIYHKTEASKSDYSIPLSTENAILSTSLIVPANSAIKDLSFENLLKAPAELMGRGEYSSLYKVIFDDRQMLAVKRIKDWGISGEDFKMRMEKIDQVRHPNVLPPLAFYCSKQEKLVVYGYQQNGSLVPLLQGKQSAQTFDWGSRLNVAATIVEALAYMHKELYTYGICHGNLKSSNILFNENMDPCISEYGLMLMMPDSQTMSLLEYDTNDYFKVDVYNLGIILLELLTGKVGTQSNGGINLSAWVHSVVTEEWTVEVFDKVLIAEGASQERMVNLLQVALKCISPSPDTRPTISQVVRMISTIKEEEEGSIVSDI